jgi:hypothetical protein
MDTPVTKITTPTTASEAFSIFSRPLVAALRHLASFAGRAVFSSFCGVVMSLSLLVSAFLRLHLLPPAYCSPSFLLVVALSFSPCDRVCFLPSAVFFFGALEMRWPQAPAKSPAATSVRAGQGRGCSRRRGDGREGTGTEREGVRRMHVGIVRRPLGTGALPPS